MILLLFLILFFLAGAGFAGDLLYIDYQKRQNIYPAPTPVPGQIFTPISASGSYQKDKYGVFISLVFPKEGGSVTGSFSGDCNGTISGFYDGETTGMIRGKAVGSCDPFFVPIPASADFTGNVNMATKSIPITGTGSAMGFSGSGNVTLTL